MWIWAIGFLVLFTASLIMPWVQRAKIARLRDEVEGLKRNVSWLLSVVVKERVDVVSEADIPEVAPANTHAQHQRASTQSPWKTAATIERPQVVKSVDPSKNEWKPAVQRPRPAMEPKEKKPFNFEQQFGANLPVWIGGIALALAGVFMVKYSIETGLLSPLVRLALGGLFGVGLMGAGYWVRSKSPVANDARIAQALSGAGLVDLYACVFAATSIYHLLPAAVGFSGMALVTASAVFLSLRHGAPIALLGLVGGFLTPALVGSSEPNAPLLFVYLYALLAGLFVLIRRKNWWFLAIPTVVAAFGWVLLWMVTSFVASDGAALGLFVLAVAATVVQQSKKAMEEGGAQHASAFYAPSALNYLSIGGALLLMSFIAAQSNFELMEWALFGLLTSAGLALSYFNEKLYGFVPKLSLAVNAIMLLVWTGADPQTLNIVLVSFAAMYVVGGYVLMWSARNPAAWAVLSVAASLVYYLIAYDLLRNELVLQLGGISMWTGLAFLLSAISVSTVKQIMDQYFGPEPIKQKMLAAFSVGATAFLSLGLFMALHAEFFSLALVSEVVAVCWINSRVNIISLRPIARILTVGYIVVLSIGLMDWQNAIDSMRYAVDASSDAVVPFIQAPWLYLGFPAAAFAASSVLLRRRLDDGLVRRFEMIALVLATSALYFLTRHAFHPDDNLLMHHARLAERGTISSLFMMLAVSALWVSRTWNRPAASKAAIILIKLSLLRIGYYDFIIYNPLSSHQFVGSTPLVNVLLLSYGLPILWLVLINKELRLAGMQSLLKITNPCLLGLAFALVSLNVRQFFHGEYLDSFTTSNAEVYAYSAAWLLMGIALLFIGTYRKDKALRLASLAFIMVSVGKVFLYDASELTGLLRVFSFLGLGVSLIGLSWFYNRFIANRDSQVG